MRKTRDSSRTASRYVESLSIVAAATGALILALMGGMDWPRSLIVICGISLLTGGIVFTLLEMYKQVRPPAEAEPKRTESRPVQTFEPLVMWPVLMDPYPHHEDHPESPGQDQGQMTSHLPGSTLVLEELAAAYQKWRRRV